MHLWPWSNINENAESQLQSKPHVTRKHHAHFALSIVTTECPNRICIAKTRVSV